MLAPPTRPMSSAMTSSRLVPARNRIGRNDRLSNEKTTINLGYDCLQATQASVPRSLETRNASGARFHIYWRKFASAHANRSFSHVTPYSPGHNPSIECDMLRACANNYEKDKASSRTSSRYHHWAHSLSPSRISLEVFC